MRKIPDTTAFIGAGTAVKAIWTMLIAGCITNGISFCIKQTVDCVLYRLPDKLVQVTQKLHNQDRFPEKTIYGVQARLKTILDVKSCYLVLFNEL